MTDWIIDRLPTRADADRDGDVVASASPRLCKELWMFEKWHDVTSGWPWRHTDFWTPPTPAPEPTPAAPEFRVGQVWRTRKGKVCEIVNIAHDRNLPIHTNLYMSHWHRPNGGSCLASDDQDHEDDLVELISDNPPQPEPVVATPTPAAPEAKPAARGFLAFTRVVSGSFRIDSAVGTDNTAWVRYCNISNEVLMDWQQVDSLPQPGEE